MPVDMSRHAEKLDQVLAALVQAEKALEVNTSGLRQKLGETMPNLPILKRYHALGGRLVTLGSDAHCTEDLGKGIDQGMDLLAPEAGGVDLLEVADLQDWHILLPRIIRFADDL